MTETLYLKTLEGALEDVLDIPLWGSPPPFPLEAFSEALAMSFDVDGVEIAVKQTELLSQEQVLKGFGKAPSITPFILSPLPGTYFLILSKEGKQGLVSTLMYKEEKHKPLSDETLENGFFLTLLLTACNNFGHLNPFGNLAAGLEDQTPLPEESCLCIDLAIKVNEEAFPARILVPKDAHAAFKTHFATEKKALLSDSSLKDISVSLALDIGSTQLSAKQWQSVESGDFILLDRCTFDAEHNRGTAQLTLGNTPLFDVRIKEGEFKILEHALPLEEPYMKDEYPSEEEDFSSPELEDKDESSPLWSSEEGSTADESLLSSQEIPLTLTVEVGRFKMPLSKLTELKSGNVLELGFGPNLNVQLTLAGKTVAKGELVKIGDAVGVKVLKVGE